MNDLVELLIRSMVAGVGTGIGNFFVLRLLFRNIEKFIGEKPKANT